MSWCDVLKNAFELEYRRQSKFCFFVNEFKISYDVTFSCQSRNFWLLFQSRSNLKENSF